MDEVADQHDWELWANGDLISIKNAIFVHYIIYALPPTHCKYDRATRVVISSRLN